MWVIFLKVQEDRYKDLPGMEYTCNRIARLLLLEVPKHYLIVFNQRLTFVTYNFMQDSPRSTLHHIYKFLPTGDHHNCSDLIEVIKEQTGRLVDVAKLIKICLFDAMIGNNDRHGRNLGIIVTQNNKKLAPMYDNPSYFGIENKNMLSADLNPSCSIWTAASKEPKLLDYIEEFQRLGFHKVCDQLTKRFLKQFKAIEQEVRESYISKKTSTSLFKVFKKEGERL